MTAAKVSVARLMRDITLRVEIPGLRTWRGRLWLGGVLLRLAARVMGCGIRVDGPAQPPQAPLLSQRGDWPPPTAPVQPDPDRS